MATRSTSAPATTPAPPAATFAALAALAVLTPSATAAATTPLPPTAALTALTALTALPRGAFSRRTGWSYRTGRLFRWQDITARAEVGINLHDADARDLRGTTARGSTARTAAEACAAHRNPRGRCRRAVRRWRRRGGRHRDIILFFLEIRRRGGRGRREDGLRSFGLFFLGLLVARAGDRLLQQAECAAEREP